MKRQVRCGVFETNSSSVHSLCMCMESDYEKWKNGEMVFDRWSDELIPITDEIREEIESSLDDYSGHYFTYEDFFDYGCNRYETFETGMTTPNGEEVVSFGYYGYDG